MQRTVPTLLISLQRTKTKASKLGGLLLLTISSVVNAAPLTVNTNTLSNPASEIQLMLDGAIKHGNAVGVVELSLEMIQQLPQRVLHTGTAVTDDIHKFEGPLMRDLLELVGAYGEITRAIALNGYSVDIPSSDFYNYDVILATHMDDKQLQPNDKGPYWIVYPRDQVHKLQDIRYDYRWVWQLKRLTIK